MMRIKKNDHVAVISGKDKGKEGTVLAISLKKEKVKIQGVNIVTKHVKARKKGDVSSIKKEEAFIYLAKVMPVCPACKKPSRVGAKQLENGARVRICNRCKEII